MHEMRGAQAVISADKLRDYIAFARARCKPELTEESSALLVEEYLMMRRAGMDRRRISATPRQLESLIRLAEAQVGEMGLQGVR